jgi:hypothetical protein
MFRVLRVARQMIIFNAGRYWVSVEHMCNKLCLNYLVIFDMNNTRHFRLLSSFFSPFFLVAIAAPYKMQCIQRSLLGADSLPCDHTNLIILLTVRFYVLT